MEKSMRVAKVLVGIGALLTSVPVGVSLAALFTSGENVVEKATSLGWALWVTVGLFPLGLALLVVGMGWLVKLKKKVKAAEEADDD